MFSAIEQAQIDLIAKKLREGMIHPGDPDRDIPPTPIMLPFKSAPGRPKEMDNLLDGTVKLLSEAIVSAMTTEGGVELVPRAEAATLRVAAGESGGGPRTVPIHCRCDNVTPLAVITVDNPDRIVTDGRLLLGQLHKRSAKCPHKVISE